MEPSDEALCRSVANREPEAFDLLVERYQERAYRIAWSVVRDREDAKDCAQEAFIRCTQGEAAVGFGESKFSTWFYRILVNCCLDHRRRGRGWRRLLVWRDAEDEDEAGGLVESQPAPPDDPGERMDEDQKMSRIWEAVETLSPQQRAAVTLQCREGLATKEIASVLGTSEATVRVHLHRAFATLRRRVGGTP